jgi:hypothetical protein
MTTRAADLDAACGLRANSDSCATVLMLAGEVLTLLQFLS